MGVIYESQINELQSGWFSIQDPHANEDWWYRKNVEKYQKELK